MERRLCAAVLKRRRPTKRRRRARGTHARTVLRHALKRQQTLVQKTTKNVRQELVKRRTMTHTKTRQRLMAHLLVPNDPTERIVRRRAPSKLARAPHANRNPVHPKRQKHPRAQKRKTLNGLRFRRKPRQLQRLQNTPHKTSTVVRRKRVLGHLKTNHTLTTHGFRHPNAGQ